MLVLLIVAACVPPLVGAAPAAVWTEDQRLTASDGDDYDGFGEVVAVDGNLALVGAPEAENATGVRTGAAYVYAWDGSRWVEQAKLTPSDGTSYDSFGTSVALDGDTALVGARDGRNATGNRTGAVYVYGLYDVSYWMEEAKLTPSDGTDWQHFGSSVALDGDTALIGAEYAENATGTTTGAAYVYAWDGSRWVEQARLIAYDAGTYDNFGRSVALDGGTALVGAPFSEDDAGATTGAAYVYERQDAHDWLFRAKLTASDGASYDTFGRSVALEGDTALVGAHMAEEATGTETGAAYVYARHDPFNWTEEQKLTPSDGEEWDSFGFSVALDGDTALVGAYHASDGDGVRTGAAYVYAWDGSRWVEQARLTPDAGTDYDNFGWSVDLDGGTAIVGAANADNTKGIAAGSAHAFSSVVERVEETQGSAQDAVQDDAGTGGDASDDPSDPTMLPGGAWIPVNGSLAPQVDEVDAYGTAISKNTTRSMSFTFETPPGQPVSVELYDPSGHLVDSASTPLMGGGVTVTASAPSGSNLTAGTWTTVLTVDSSASTSSTVERTGAGASASVPDLPGLTFGYDGERECHPRC